MLSVEKLELIMGNCYTSIGESGCGKSSLLSLIRGITNDHIKSSGSISYPTIEHQPLAITMVSQHEYFPLDLTLLEIIYYPLRFSSPEEQTLVEEKITTLLREMNIDNHIGSDSKLGIIALINEKLNWYNVLSGGQKKKILLFRQLLKIHIS